MQKHEKDYAEYEPSERKAKALKSGSEDDSGAMLDKRRYCDVPIQFAAHNTDHQGYDDRLQDVVHDILLLGPRRPSLAYPILSTIARRNIGL